VAWALEKLWSDISKNNSDNTEALLMVYVEHLTGDIYQPLHTITKVDQQCVGDKGGNDFCLRENRRGKCTKNLHSLWDSAVGYLKPHENIQQLADVIQNIYPKELFTDALKDNNKKDWLSNNYQLASFVYSAKILVKPTPNYYKEGQKIAKKQIALAGYRLAQELNLVFK
jgi:hypothetical protein